MASLFRIFTGFRFLESMHSPEVPEKRRYTMYFRDHLSQKNLCKRDSLNLFINIADI